MERKAISYLMISLLLSFVSFSQNEGVGERLKGAICQVTDLLKSVLAPLLILVIVLAALTYGAGHVLGQEFGARAKSWALNMIIFAVIGVIIYLVAPFIFKAIAPEIDIETACA